jgi:excisionase family DNA binding protein
MPREGIERAVDRLFRKSEVQELFALSEPTVDRLIASGRLPVVKISARAVRVAESALVTFIKDHTERRGAS